MEITTIISIIGAVISVVSVSGALYFSLKNSKHTDAKDVEEQTKEKIEEIKERTKENAIIGGKLDLINSSNQEIKEQISSLVKKIDAHENRLIKVEESLSSVWKRIDEILKKIE